MSDQPPAVKKTYGVFAIGQTPWVTGLRTLAEARAEAKNANRICSLGLGARWFADADN